MYIISDFGAHLECCNTFLYFPIVVDIKLYCYIFIECDTVILNNKLYSLWIIDLKCGFFQMFE